MSWYTTKGSMGQGLVIDEADGRTVAVAYDEKDAPLLAAAPDMLEALKWVQARLFMHEGASDAYDAASVAITLASAIRKGQNPEAVREIEGETAPRISDDDALEIAKTIDGLPTERGYPQDEDVDRLPQDRLAAFVRWADAQPREAIDDILDRAGVGSDYVYVMARDSLERSGYTAPAS